jgi:hypothetical protein
MLSYNSVLNQSPEIIISGDIVIPPKYIEETNFIIPDEIVEYCISQYGLLTQNMRIIDPMCGLGTIPRVINAKGGDCIGIEINKARFDVALTVTKHDKIFHGNFLEIDLPTAYFQSIFTSLPFDWFKISTHQVPISYVEKFKTLLVADGFLLIDSVPAVHRLGQTWPVASRQYEYFVANGFALVEMIRFMSSAHQDISGESVIMKFKRNN